LYTYLGEANAGKTRLAFEALIAALPDWSVLVGSPTYSSHVVLPAKSLHGRKLVIFVDDMPDYVSDLPPLAGASATSDVSTTDFYSQADLTQLLAVLQQLIDARATTLSALGGPIGVLSALSGPAKWLRNTFDRASTAADQVIVVATCRTEGLDRARAGLAWLLEGLHQIMIPRFAIDDQSSAARIIATFAAAGASADHTANWDGTLGSLLLGLTRKEHEYRQLRVADSPAVPVLHSMKLLASVGIHAHTERRLRAVCATVFGQPAVRESVAIWRAAVADLTRLQFVSVAPDPNSGDTILLIRKDAYFDQVITAYPNPARPQRFDRDRFELLSVFEALGDAPALFDLGTAYSELGHYAEAHASIDRAIALAADSGNYWDSKGDIYTAEGLYQEALDAYEHALQMSPSRVVSWRNKANTLRILGRTAEADTADARATELDNQ
jgi:Tetratricopeptide repeat